MTYHEVEDDIKFSPRPIINLLSLKFQGLRFFFVLLCLIETLGPSLRYGLS
jgi:hypothetical protein